MYASDPTLGAVSYESGPPPGYWWEDEPAIFTVGWSDGYLYIIPADPTQQQNFGSSVAHGPVAENAKAAVLAAAQGAIPASAHGTATGLYRNREPGDPPGSIQFELASFTVESPRVGPVVDPPSMEPETIRRTKGLLYVLGGSSVAFNREDNDPLHTTAGQWLVGGGADAAAAAVRDFLGSSAWAYVSGVLRQSSASHDPDAKILDLTDFEIIEPAHVEVAIDPFPSGNGNGANGANGNGGDPRKGQTKGGLPPGGEGAGPGPGGDPSGGGPGPGGEGGDGPGSPGGGAPGVTSFGDEAVLLGAGLLLLLIFTRRRK